MIEMSPPTFAQHIKLLRRNDFPSCIQFHVPITHVLLQLFGRNFLGNARIVILQKCGSNHNENVPTGIGLSRHSL